MSNQQFRLFHFDVLNIDRKELEPSLEDEDVDDNTYKKSDKIFVTQMYGINERGETACIYVDDFQPFFYVKIPNQGFETGRMLSEIKKKTPLESYELVEKKSLYGFTANNKSKFVKLVFKNTIALAKAKALWIVANPVTGAKSLCYYKNKQGTIVYNNKCPSWLRGTQLFESNLPPMLRMFHINQIWPNGWVNVLARPSGTSHTTCKYEYICGQSCIKALPDKETAVPYKIMSFDIEAGSSHGDFPLPKKTYKRLAMNMVDVLPDVVDIDEGWFRKCVLTAFHLVNTDSVSGIDRVYPKSGAQSKKRIEAMIDFALKSTVSEATKNADKETRKLLTLDALFEKMRGKDDAVVGEDADADAEDADEDVCDNASEDDDGDDTESSSVHSLDNAAKINILDVLRQKGDRDNKVQQLDQLLTSIFPPLEGDPITMIGSTFMYHGQKEPYMNHCITLGPCASVSGAVIESAATEQELLLRWRDLVLAEDPDIIIGYNIFGFDYEFMFRRAEETRCAEEFLLLSRKVGQLCGNRDKHDASLIELEHSKIAIASGEYDLRYINMGGRLQIDMYNYFRRNFQLSSYKLDDVASQNISDDVIKVEGTRLWTKNITGLHVGDYIHIEITSFTSDHYVCPLTGTTKFVVQNIEDGATQSEKIIVINAEIGGLSGKKIRWTMAKDDVSPQEIFRMSHGAEATPDSRAKVAKYCIQDCNLVHHLMRKIDVMTEYMEMANLCSVPINFLVFRGQGIKLTSYVAKKCMEKGYLMPDLEKARADGGYEGAIVLPPKTKIYIDEPVACVDYSSLYPSSMISQNYCHSSKVWAKEYDLEGTLLKEEGEKDATGKYVYYGLPGYDYVEIEFDTFEWRRNPANPAAKAKKTKVGKRVVCWAQLPGGEKSVMPSILMELLKAREETKKKAKKVAKEDPFMANILDKRQLAYKVSANSIYGQCGARTSTFYEKDVAASTTASGRMSITYARRIIEEIYANRVCNVKNANYPNILTNAEYVYGDTDSVFFIFNLTNTETGEKIVGKDALEITIELAQEAAHYATMFLKPPMNLAYEKTLMPFALLSKKRYVGILYEEDPNKGKLKYMGLSLKRRDSCDYLKDTYGQIINMVMKGTDIMSAIQYLDDSLKSLIAGAVPTEKLEITKALRSYYKNPQQIAHRVLADRIGQRDPGNMPKAGDRMRFIHIVNPNKKALQGDKIETPEYIKEARLKIDYDFYITNQLLKPICQFMGLALEEIWKKQGKPLAIKKYRDEIAVLAKEYPDFEQFIKKKEKLCTEKVKALLFDKHLMQIQNNNARNQPITAFFGKR